MNQMSLASEMIRDQLVMLTFIIQREQTFVCSTQSLYEGVCPLASPSTQVEFDNIAIFRKGDFVLIAFEWQTGFPGLQLVDKIDMEFAK